MIPINDRGETTPLSIDKTAKLLQALLDLNDSNESDSSCLPPEVEKAVEDLMLAQKMFVKQIDKFLHKTESYDEGKNVDTIATMIELCPELLATKDPVRYQLPICKAAMNKTIRGKETFVPLFARVGVQYEVGGKEARGGLLTDSGRHNEYANSLQCLASEGEGATGTFEALRNAKPEPLFLENDVIEHSLLYNAIVDFFDDESYSFDSFASWMCQMKYFIDLNEEGALFHMDSANLTPLCYFFDDEIKNVDENLILKKFLLKGLEYILERSVYYNPSCPTIGGLFHVLSEGEIVLTKLVDKYGEKQMWDCIEKVLTSISFNDQEYPLILHQTIIWTQQYVSQALMRFPDALHDRALDNRLPIHEALDNGLSWDANLVAIIQANNLHLKVCDPVTKLPLMALAAKEPSCDLRTIYYLLRKNPECVDRAIENHKRKNKQKNQVCDDGAKQPQKRGRGRPRKKSRVINS
jgi:hypothetical protein